MPHMPEERYRCPECQDRNWVDVVQADLSLAPAVRPCQRCQPTQYRRWREGHLAQKCGGVGKCQECTGIHTGEIHAFDYLPDGTLPIGFLSP